MEAIQTNNNDMITITLPDGATREYVAGTTGMDIAESISKSLAKACVMIEVNRTHPLHWSNVMIHAR
jgi:threonyl-tRNA synthetase